jgi:hypothetical protein
VAGGQGLAEGGHDWPSIVLNGTGEQIDATKDSRAKFWARGQNGFYAAIPNEFRRKPAVWKKHDAPLFDDFDPRPEAPAGSWTLNEK